MKWIFEAFVNLLWLTSAFSQTEVEITILNAGLRDGKVLLSVFSNAADYGQKKVFAAYELASDRIPVVTTISLKPGKYVFTVFQDRNGNGKADTNLIGIPVEKFGFSNYNAGGVPGVFEKHQLGIGGARQKIRLNLYQL